jgi:hypothetical protein
MKRAATWPATSNRVRAGEAFVALACFLALCVVALSHPPELIEPDAFAYRASIVALSRGHLTLSTSQYQELRDEFLTTDEERSQGIAQWIQRPDGRWVSEKNPGYPFFAVPFQSIGVLRLAPLFYGALGCVGLFVGGRRWLGGWGGTWAVGLFCSSGAAMLFAWRDTMPTFTESSLLAAGTGAILWAVLAEEAGPRLRTIVGFLGFLALEGAVFVRYTDVVILGCVAVAVLLVRWLAPAVLPRRAPFWWIASAAVFGLLLLTFNSLVYGSAFSTGYTSGVVTFSLGALPGNLQHMPLHLTKAMPAFWLALGGLVWIVARSVRLRRSARPDGRRNAFATAHRDLAVGAGLAATWFGTWGLYAMYDWTAQTSAGAGSTLQVVRFFVPSLAPIALLGAWPLVRLPRWLAGAAIVVFFGLGLWSFTAMRTSGFATGGGLPPGQGMPSGGGPGGPGASPPPGQRPSGPPPGADPP